MDARDFLDAWGVDRPTVDVFSLAEQAGISVVRYRGLEWLGALDLLDGEARIFTQAEASEGDQRFALAHEIGHVALHAPSSYRCDLVARDQRERDANLYAQDLLMPSDLLYPFYESAGGNAVVLARIFGVPVEAMRVRIRRLLGQT